ncbi:hypothetical protein [Streptococcus sp. HMSC076C09]|uniref:hypothetical protein n=1 Tax=Streptococcus sp. HMSC076C09 TaxID=1715183 RepID=UPI0008A93528|nr:hypothetical protein [Streptococcus sp. HMSC076C09]MBS6986960.1 hypothetical protein [Streptococcus parasanguinis]MDU7552637.1 hypothetical protein [Streptococcus parasanguinis]OHQ90259.1 hypothetical protein HMPREF2704_01695 [Streptococcus sp. HMSC076C09]
MTKKILPLTLTILTVGLISYALLNPVVANSLGSGQKENQTIEIYKELLKNKSEKEINEYFSNLPDDQLIIADKAGGFTTSSTDDYSSPVETIDKDGNREVKSFQDKTVSATIGEIKEALKNN